MKHSYGERSICRRCNLEIEFHGNRTWLDRGANWKCAHDGRKHQPNSMQGELLEPAKVAANVERFGGTAGDDFAHLPENCPSNHWNRGDDICGDCGENLQ